VDRKIIVARCHEIQLASRDKEISKFEAIPEIGMAVQLALHICGLPLIEYERLKLVAAALLGIPRLAVERIVRLLAEIEFVSLVAEGSTIKSVLPTVPFFDRMYDGLGEYFQTQSNADEFEKLTLEIVDKLASSPHNIDALAAALGTDRKSFDQSIEIGVKGSFLISRRSRAKVILLNPSYFSENAEIFSDHVAKSGAKTVQKTLELIRLSQGWPLALIEKNQEINGTKVGLEEISLLKRLAQDGIVKPPSITTEHAGQNQFIFTPTPASTNISPLKRETYERALAVVSAVRQGQLLPNKFRIRSPGALLYKLKTELKLGATSDYAEQYQNLVHLRVAKLEQLTNGYRQLKIIDTPENREALTIAHNLVQGTQTPNLGTDSEAASAMTGSQEYAESLVSSKLMREKEIINLNDETRAELGQLLLEGF
jgi:hypothetical protein